MSEDKDTKNRNIIRRIYEDKYKLLLIIPFVLLLAAIVQIGIQTASTGDFIHKGVSLKGGVTLIVPVDEPVDIDTLKSFLSGKFKDHDINVRTISKAGSVSEVVVEADIDLEDASSVDELVKSTGDFLKKKLTEKDYSLEGVGSSLGSSF